MRHSATTASIWVTTHLACDARKYAEANLEIGGRDIYVTHDAERRAYAWTLDGKETSREAVEVTIDRILLG